MKGIEKLVIYQSVAHAATAAAFTIHGNIHSHRNANANSISTIINQGIQTSQPIAASSALSTRLCAKEDDVNDLFSAYMAQRKDNPLASGNSSTSNANKSNSNSNSNTSNSNTSNTPEPEPPKKRWAPGQRLKKILSSNASEANYVQPISLGRESENSNKDNRINQNEPESPIDAYPPSLPKSDMETINTSLEKFATEMKFKLDQLRAENPDAVPPNADDILQQVVEQRRNFEMRERNQQRAVESFDEYEQRMKRQLQNQQKDIQMDKVLEDDPVVKEIIEEAEKDYQAAERRQEEIRKFKEYEESLRSDLRKRDVVVNAKTMKSVSTDNKDLSFEELQLNSLQDLLEKRNRSAENGGFDDEDIYLTDNIEDGIEELRRQIDKSSASSSTPSQPESLKEWQMYRAIATKLANRRKGIDGVDGGGAQLSDQLAEDSDEIQSKLEGWKEFQIKEEEMRAKSGLTIKYRLPFEWSDKPDVKVETKPKKRGPIDREKAEKARSELDDLAVDVMNTLMEKTDDAGRKEKLRNEIEGLKESMRARQEALKNRGPEVIKEKKKVVPVTIGDILGTNKKKKPIVEKNAVEDDIVADLDVIMDAIDDANGDADGDDYEDDYEEEIEDDTPPPPDSEFFRDLEEKEAPLFTEEEEPEELDESAPSLGTFEQQKFRSLVARSGVRTVEGQNALKQQWDDFQQAEKKMREQSGLSIRSATDVVTPTPKVNYDVNALFKDDGDIDFDKILSSIGTRPSRKNKGATAGSTAMVAEPVASSTAVADSPTEQETKIPVNEQRTEEPKIENTDPRVGSPVKEEKTEIDSIAETKEAVEQNQTSERGSLTFGEDRKLEVERNFLSEQFSGFEKRKADLLDCKILSVSQVDTLIGIKSSPYSSGVSPYLARMNKPFKDYGAIFSLEGVLVDVTGLQFNAWKQTAQIYDFPCPALEDVRFASVHNEEFAIQRVFHWTDDIFAARKVAKTFRELRKAVFDEWKESSETKDENLDSNVSVNVENSDGADGSSAETTDETVDVETDITQIQLVAWERAAQSYGFLPPTRDLVSIVNNMKPDEAVRAVFRWTNDLLVSSDVGGSYRRYLKEETSKWLKKGGNIPVPTETITTANGSGTTGSIEANKSSTPGLEDVLKLKRNAWEKALKNGNYKFDPPTLDEIQVVEFVGRERAIASVFKWDVTPDESKTIMNDYREELKVLTKEMMKDIGDSEILTQPSSSVEESTSVNLPLFVLKGGVNEWLTALEDINVPSAIISNMEKELVDDILEEMGLSRHFPDENRVCSSSGYGSEMQQMLGGALRLERRPDHCIVFSATPQSAGACRQVEMKNVAIVSPYPYYELTTSDMTVRDFGSIGVRNLKNVFSEITIEEPMLQIQVEEPRILRQTMLKTRFWDDGDR